MKSPQAKTRLSRSPAPMNVEKMMTAPVTAIVASKFLPQLPGLNFDEACKII